MPSPITERNVHGSCLERVSWASSQLSNVNIAVIGRQASATTTTPVGRRETFWEELSPVEDTDIPVSISPLDG